MTIVFAQCRDDPRKVDKTLTEVHTVNNASIYQACSIMAPEFVVDYSLSLLSCNYLVAGVTAGQNEIARCYFIKDQIVLPGGRLVVRCAIDVLNTWKNTIKDCKANVIRQESENHLSNPSRFIYDQNMVGVVSTHIDNIPFVGGTPFTSPGVDEYCYVMTVLGGTQHTSPSLEVTTK
jgi:hypothetical protein